MKTVKKIEGTVTKSVVNEGSKSEHETMILTTATGKVYSLKMRGQNPFSIVPELQKLNHKKIAVFNGSVFGTTLRVNTLDQIAVKPTRSPANKPPRP